jgi:Domain of unknown function (DUF2017)
MAAFERSAAGIHVSLEEHEADLLRQLAQEMSTLLEVDISADPVNKRLFPDAYESESDSDSYRELVGAELHSEKLEALKQLRSTIGESGDVSADLSEDEMGMWLRVVNDIRLAIGTRNDVTEETMGKEIDPEDPESAGLLVLHWLGWMQEAMLRALSGRPSEEDE